MAKVKRRISTRYCVHSGSPSWHQRRAGHGSSGADCFWKKSDAQKFMRRVRKKLPAHEPVFITTERKLRHFDRELPRGTLYGARRRRR
jgi:hypothetical protein